MAMKIRLEIKHKEIIIVMIKGLSKIKIKVFIIMSYILENPMITIDNIGKIIMNKKVKDSKNIDI
jgi:hypothetical protein